MKKRIICLIILFVLLSVAVIAAVCAPSALSYTPVSIIFGARRDMIKNRNNLFVSNATANSGKYEIITAGEGDAPYIKLLCDYQTSLPPYRCSPYFTTKGSVEKNPYVRVRYRTADALAATITLVYSTDSILLVPNTSVSHGEWVVSDPIKLVGGVFDRLNDGDYVYLCYTGAGDECDILIKDLTFFKSEADAYAYFGDEKPKDTGLLDVDLLTFGDAGNTEVLCEYDGSGAHKNTDNGEATAILYSDRTELSGTNYEFKFRIKDAADYSPDKKFVRVLYSAKNPAGEAPLLVMNSESTKSRIPLCTSLADSDRYVLSDAVKLPDNFASELADGKNLYISATARGTDGEYSIKALLFFSTKAEADAFAFGGGKKIEINGNDISKYSVIVSESPGNAVQSAAYALQKQVFRLTGHILPIKNDSETESDHEILLGKSRRDLSAFNETDPDLFHVGVTGKKLVITSTIPADLPKAVDTLLCTYLYKDASDLSDAIRLPQSLSFDGKYPVLYISDIYREPENVDEPVTFAEDFSFDDGYFTEEQGGDLWRCSDGKYTVKATDRTVSYVHVYEPNVFISSFFNYSFAGERAEMSLVARYTAKNSYVRAGYDFSLGEWYIEYREGDDFYPVRCARKKADISPDTDYLLSLRADGGKLTFFLGGTELLSASTPHVTSGRIGLCAADIGLSADDFCAVLLSGEGTILKNVEHTVLPGSAYREGGTVISLDGGTLEYFHNSGVGFASADDGKTWERSLPSFSINYLKVNILELSDGSIIQRTSKNINGKACFVSARSTDRGKTWTTGGVITSVVHETYGVDGSTMNDKFFETSGGRIFFAVDYDGYPSNGQRVCECEIFYSDDKGATWQKSKTSSVGMRGEYSTLFLNEPKILECADGTLRVYFSQDMLGNIMYSESSDGGVSWGAIRELDGFVCSPSSMQFVRDPYGPTNTTYWMFWPNNERHPTNENVPVRARVSLAYSTDGKTWQFVGDIWRWESRFAKVRENVTMAQFVDPFIYVTKSHIICGTGVSEFFTEHFHNAQRQHIWAIARDTLPEPTDVGTFTDVGFGARYYDAVTYVSSAGLMAPAGKHTFAPNEPITLGAFSFAAKKLGDSSPYINSRAQVSVQKACMMLCEAAKGKSAAPSGQIALDFDDFGDVSPEAREALTWAVDVGVFAGIEGYLAPNKSLSRAQAAILLYNFAKIYG